MRKNRKSMLVRLEEHRSRRMIYKAINEAPSQTVRDELLVVAQRQLGQLR